MRMLALLTLMLVAAVPANADVMYSYVGDTFKGVTTGAYTNMDHVVGSFVVASPFTDNPNGWAAIDRTSSVLRYSFSDGVQTLTEANSTARIAMYVNEPFHVGPDFLPVFGASGWWDIEISTTTGRISTSMYGSDGTDFGCRGCLGLGLPVESGTMGTGSGGLQPLPEFGGHGGGHIGTWSLETVSVPELAILPRLPRVLKFGLGLGLEARVTTTLQRATAWLAAAILRAPREGVMIRMPSVSVEVAEACSGLQTLGLLLSVGALIGAVLPARRLPWALALVVAAVVLALEANALRVAGIAIGLEYVGPLSLATKDWIGAGTTGLALVQMAVLGRLVGLGRLLGR